MIDRLLELIRDVHRRSLWQVLGVYVASSWGVLQVIEFLIETAGLPEWVQPFALVLLLIGLPIVLATAFVQEGSPGRARGADRPMAEAPPPTPLGVPEPDAPGAAPSRRARWLTWRNALLAGAAAFALLVVVVGAFYAMRNLGIGPAGTLSAQGVLDARDEILLADFEGQAGDSSLAPVVTEALRVDLGNSDFLRLTEANRITSVLGRMGREDERLPEDVALEAATREGIKAVLAGEVSRLGPGHVLTARILEPATGNTLASFRSVARTEADLIDAIDELSGSIRAKVGESLRSVARSEPLAAVTTGSLEALRLYTRAVERSRAGDEFGAIPLLEDAVEVDPAFAMAHRKLAVALANTGGSLDRIREAATRAHELGRRLTDRERHLADAYYYENVEADRERAIEAYEAVLAIDPDDPTAQNNLGLALVEAGRFEEAERVLRRAVRTTDITTPYVNLVRLMWITRRDDEAAAWLDSLSASSPDAFNTLFMTSGLRQARRRWAEGHDADAASAGLQQLPPQVRMFLTAFVANADVGLGRLEEARAHWAEALEDARRTSEPARWTVAMAGLWAINEFLASQDTARAVRLVEDALAEFPPGTLEGYRAELFQAGAVLAAVGRTDRAEALVSTVADGPDAVWDESERLARQVYAFWLAYGRERYEEAIRIQRGIREDLPGCDRARCQGTITLALALDAAGRVDEAIEAYEEHVDGSVVGDVALDAAALGTALERLALLHASQGRAAEARAYLARLADMWGDADPPLANRVRRVERELASLVETAGT
ncbi:MAG TPA: tetratricopeptide repeat protein [Longimicrobiales bacterium]|nr:tetratricopeptide repeat protein [Longimicrobiales bacterium]